MRILGYTHDMANRDRDSRSRGTDEGTSRSRSRGTLLPTIAVGMAVAFSLFGDMAMYVVLPVAYADLGLTAFQVGVLLSVNRWVRLITNHVAERLLRRYGRKLLFPAALALGSLLAAGYSIAPAFLVLVALRVTWGVCWSFIRHTGVTTTVSLAGADRAGSRMGIYVGIVQVGFVGGTLVSGALFDAAGFRTTFLFAAAVSLAAVPVGFAGSTRRARVAERPRKPTGDGRGALLLEARGFIVALVGTGLIMSTLGFLLRSRFGAVVPVGSLVIGVTTINGVLLAGRYVINGIGSPLFGAAIDRYGLGGVQITGFVVAALSLFAAGLLEATALLIPLILVFFVGAAVARLSVEAQAAVSGARAYSRMATATDLGSAVGPLLGWLGIEIAESAPVFWIGGGLFVVGLALSGVEVISSRARPGTSYDA